MKRPIPYSINANGKLIDLSVPKVMGILNVTPDSFYAASRAEEETAITNRVIQVMEEGADIIDIGACSTRPGAS
ncbi:MAG: dihydropteroate synthase, partial [Bacteroidaceae bacterium]|nr:dihydropteroate synthase [Bacteroidaceae bacterium]